MEAESKAKAAARNWTGGAERFMDGESHRWETVFDFSRASVQNFIFYINTLK